jgi:hypothetical protein
VETRVTDRRPDSSFDEESRAPATPRWVKVFGVIAILVALLIGLILFTGLGGQHGPQRHADGAGLAVRVVTSVA